MKGRKKSPGRLYAEDLCAKFPNHGDLTLAKKAYKDSPKLFLSLEQARQFIRHARGHNGNLNRKKTSVKDLFKPVTYNTNPYKLPESHANPWEPFIISQSRVLIISDLHFPYQDNRAITAALNYGKMKNANAILINGDLIDFATISRHERDWRQRSVKEEFDATRTFLVSLRKNFPKARIIWKHGNHCFDTQTEILTKDGWKKYDEISYNDYFATFKSETSEIEYHKAEKIHILDYKGKMFKVDTRSIDMLVTPDHRLYMKYGSKNSDYGNFNVVKAREVNSSSPRVSFMSAGIVNNPEFKDVTDDEIRLCAWIHTDGSVKKDDSVNKNPAYLLYQRKSKVHMITDILNRLGYDYSIKTRNRVIKQICGRDLVKENDASCTIIIRRGRNRNNNHHRLDDLIKDKYILPEWLHKLSQRQFDIFLHSLIDGDGSRHVHSKHSSMIYGVKKMLDQIQAHLVVRGYRSSLSKYRKSDYRLNILHSKNYVDIDKFKKVNEWVDYDGKVFCVTVPNGLVLVRRNGKVHVSGNCERWEKYLYAKAPEIFDMEEFELENIMRLNELKIEVVKDKRPIKIGKLFVFHGHEFTGGAGGVNPARSTFLKANSSVIVGHYHRTSQHTDITLSQDVISVNSTGCLCELHPHYMPINKHNHGFAYVDHSIKTGEYIIYNMKIVKGKVY